MKLYYSPGACSLASRIVLNELGRDAQYERVNLRTKQTESGKDYRRINPLGYVPALQFDDGAILTENAAILAFLATLESTLRPADDDFARAQLHQWLAFLASELHQSFGPFFAGAEGAARESAIAKLSTRIDHVERRLDDGRQSLLGDRFGVADAYAFVILNWAAGHNISLAPWPKVSAFLGRIANRPSVRRAMAEEGLLELAA